MTALVWRPAVLAEGQPDGRLRCMLCPHGCVLGDGQVGLCRVRRHHHGALETATFAVAVAHVDAVERKPLYHFRPGSRVLTVAAPGCTFRCDYCINYRISQYGKPGAPAWSATPADPAALVARAVTERACLGLSYTEPGLAPELTLALAAHAAPAGVPIVWKTNGFLTGAAIDLVAPVLAAVNVDVKAADDAAHRRLTGAPLAPVLDAVARFRAAGVWVEVSTPIVPGTASDADALSTIARRLAAIDPDLPWHLLRFTPDFRMRAADPTAPTALAATVAIGRAAGLHHVYVERALGAEGRTTRCPSCRTVLVERGIWETLTTVAANGRCPRCARPVAGRWEGT